MQQPRPTSPVKKCDNTVSSSSSSSACGAKAGKARRRRKKKESTTAARADNTMKVERDESPAPLEDYMSSPARTVSMTSVSSSDSSVSQSSEQSWDSDNERSAVAADEDGGPSSAEKVLLETKVEPMAEQRQQAEAVSERQAVSPSVSRSGSPSIADMLLEPPTPPRRGGGAAAVAEEQEEEENDVMWDGADVCSDEKMQWKVTAISNAAQQHQQPVAKSEDKFMMVEKEASPRGGDQAGVGDRLPAMLPMYQISSQPWEIAPSTGVRFPVPMIGDKGQLFKHRGVNGTISGAAPLAPVSAPAPSSFGGALLSQSSMDLRDLGLGMDLLLGEYPGMGEMMPSLTREMSLARAVEALDKEDQGNGGMGDVATVFSPW